MKANNPMFKYILKNDLFDALMDYSFYMHFLTGLSLFNCTTLMVQRNGVGYAASEDTWRKEFDRYIKPEAQPLIIMRPFAPLDVFYEYRDTYSPDGKELPKWIEDQSEVTSKTRKFNIPLERLIPILNKHGIYYGEKDMGSREGGTMSYVTQPMPLTFEKMNKKREIIMIRYSTHYAMTINSKSDKFRKASAVFHEIGHLLCGHLPEDEGIKKNDFIKMSIPKRDRNLISPESAEFEAEKTCELILKVLGYEYDPKEYLKGYMVDGKEPVYDLGIAVSAADQFIKWLEEDPFLYSYIRNIY